MPFRLFRMDLKGAIAVANLVLFGIALLVWMATFPDFSVNMDTATEGQLLINKIVWTVVGVLTFPVGWLTLVLTPLHGPPLAAVVLVPLNAYLWGYAVVAFCRRLRRA